MPGPGVYVVIVVALAGGAWASALWIIGRDPALQHEFLEERGVE
jgi:hypothetical protein